MQVVHSNTSSDKYGALFRQGFEISLDHFFHSYYTPLCFFASRIIGDTESAKDIASIAFTKTWAKREKLDTARAIRAYLYQVVRNDCYKWLQQQQKRTAAEKELVLISPPATESQLELVIASEVIGELYRHMQQLPPACRNVFNKLYVEGKGVSEAAAELQLSVSTVKTQKARGLAVLRQYLSAGN